MNKKHVIDYAIQHKEWHTAAFLMDHIAAEYLEGDIKSSMEVFNALLHSVPSDVILILQDISVFDCVRLVCEKRIESEISAQEAIDAG